MRRIAKAMTRPTQQSSNKATTTDPPIHATAACVWSHPSPYRADRAVRRSRTSRTCVFLTLISRLEVHRNRRLPGVLLTHAPSINPPTPSDQRRLPLPTMCAADRRFGRRRRCRRLLETFGPPSPRHRRKSIDHRTRAERGRRGRCDKELPLARTHARTPPQPPA